MFSIAASYILVSVSSITPLLSRIRPMGTGVGIESGGAAGDFFVAYSPSIS